MGETRIPDEVLDALVENTKAIDTNSEVLNEIREEEDETGKKNIVKESKIKPLLTPLEKKRYANIGKELMSPFLKSLKELIASEKKRSEMTVKDKTKTVEKEAKKKKRSLKDKGGDIMQLIKMLLPVVMVLGATVYAFKNKIANFFNGIWDWIKDFFKPVIDFFDFSSEGSPVSKVWNAISDSFSAIWKGYKNYINWLLDVYGEVWDTIQKAWNTFIKEIKSVWDTFVEEMKGAWNSFVTTINRWWEGAQKKWDDFVKTIQHYYQTAIDSITNGINYLTNKAKGLLNLFSDDEEEKPTEEVKTVTEENKIEPAKVQSQQNIEMLTDSLNNSVASSIVEQLSDQLNVGNLSEEERAKYQELIKNNLKTDNDGIAVNLEEVRKQINEEIKKGTVDAFGKSLAGLSEEAAASLNKNMNSELNKDEGMEAVHQTILNSATLIKNAFSEYVNHVKDGFAQTWELFVGKYMQPATYNISPVHKESFEKMSNELVRLAQESTDMIMQQNEVLEKIKDILATTPPPTQPSIMPLPVSANDNHRGSNAISAGAKKLMGRLWTASSHWA
jgi:hypothetical protein